MKLMLRIILFFFVLNLLGLLAFAQTIRYVKEGGAGTKDGLSWANASDNIQTMITASSSGQQVWVAVGTYTGQISLKNNVSVYGGFDPDNGLNSLENRVLPNITNTDVGSSILRHPSNSVIRNDYNTNEVITSAMLDGFTLSSAAACVYLDASSPTLINLLVINSNTGIYSYRGSKPVIKKCVIRNNSYGMYSDGASNFLMENSVITNNTTIGIYNFDSSPTVTNCVLYGNGNGITTDATNLKLRNSIVWGNGLNLRMYGGGTFDVQNSISQGGFSGVNVIDLDPQFVDAVNGNFRLKSTSPAINTGNNALFAGLNLTTLDMAGHQRLSGSTIDMGAYEYQQITPDANNILYVNAAVVGGTAAGTTWANAITELADALKFARTNNNYTSDNPLKIYVAKGTYKPLYSSKDDSYNTDGGRNNAFVMLNNVQIYGGFDPANNIAELSHARQLPSSAGADGGSVLSGDLGIANDASDNAFHLIIASGSMGNAVLDGFTIADGNANGGSNTTVFSNSLSDNHGAGIYNFGSSVAYKNLVIKNNKVEWDGSGMYNNNASPVVSNVLFTGNYTQYKGTIINYNNSSPVLVNVTITGNTSDYYSGIFNSGSTLYIYNSIVWGNLVNGSSAAVGADIFNDGTGQASVKNSITQSYTTGNATDNNLVGIDPVFTDNTNFTLQLSSPAIGKGINTYYTDTDKGNGNLTDQDLAGNKRLLNTNIDIGAYENQTVQTEPDANNILYVNINVSGGDGSGVSWANAIPKLADALKWARTKNNFSSGNPLKIYVAKGTYKPMYNAASNALTSATDRSNAFVMVNNVQIYGGFEPDNNIDDLTDTRIFGSEGSILSGDIGTAVITDNTYHVVISSGGATSRLDGFTITGGYSTSANTGNTITVNGNNIRLSYGGGMHNYSSSPTITNCIFTANTAENGGGMYNYRSSPIVNNNIFSTNKADNGGGMYSDGSDSPISNCRFTANTATRGGGMYNYSSYSYASSPPIINCTFTANTASIGGGMYNSNASSPTIVNCIFTTNIASNSGGAIFNSFTSHTITNTTIAHNGSSNGIGGNNTTLVVQNSIVWDVLTGGYTAKYSLIKDKTDTNDGNINAALYTTTDIFKDYAGGDYSLVDMGAFVNKGDNTLYTNSGGNLSTDEDLAGNPRLLNGTIDLGAYESQITMPLPDANNILYVNANVSGSTGDGSSWANAIPQLADALKWARRHNNFTTANPLKIYVANGTYKPIYNAADGNFTTDSGRDNAFVMVNNVQLYGGFDPANNIDDLTDTRVIPSAAEGSPANGTVLSGDIGTEGTNTDNAYHVVISSGAVGTALLDGFTITGAYSTSSNTETITVNGNTLSRLNGGGMANASSSPAVTNCSFTTNTTDSGGGMYNTTSSSPAITNCSFTANTAAVGGGMYNLNSSSPTIVSCIFTTNTATDGGGAIYNYTTYSSIITNCRFTDNVSTTGGAIYGSYASPVITNTTIANNGSSGFFKGVGGTPVLQNTIIWDVVTGSYTAKYSLIKDKNDTSNGNIDATGLIASDIFKNHQDGDYRLIATSPAVDKGSNALYLSAAGNFDLAGKQRLVGGIIDMGAYEFQGLMSQTISFAALDPKTTTSADFTLGATTTSGLVVSYTSSNTAVAEVYQDAGVWKVKIKGEGNTNITANQSGDGDYSAATDVVQQLIVVGTPLPVTLISYTAKAEGNHGKLQWQTSAETNNRGFEIYRSGDDKQFVKIGEVAAVASHNSQPTTYNFTDKQPLNGSNYYRLVQVDKDGKTTELGERTLNFKLSTLDFQLYPNPTTSKVVATFGVGKFTSVALTGIDGKVLKTVQLMALQQELEIDLSAYPVGMYFIRLIGTNESVVKKVIKQ